MDSSFIRCGRLPVFSSCSITPVTISSLIPSVSILILSVAPGEGGGVCSYAVLPLLLGLSTAKETDLVEEDVDNRGRNAAVGEASSDACDRFIFLAGGCGGEECVPVAALEMERR